MTTRLPFSPIHPAAFCAALLCTALLCTGCQPTRAPMTSAERADYDACRVRADQIYSQQNRAALSERDMRDVPFSTSYVSGITSAGLSSRNNRDTLLAGCTPGRQPVDSGTGPTFSGPQAR